MSRRTGSRPLSKPVEPDSALFAYCTYWRELNRQWQHRLQHWYGDANHFYRDKLRPLRDQIAATPAETEEGFAAKLAVILEDDLPSAIWSICEQQGTNYPYLLRGEDPISKGAPAKRGRPKWRQLEAA